jgi:anti-sigma factor RsiW
MTCDAALTTQAYLDGELDSAGALEAERHLETCLECAALQAQMAPLGTLLRETASYHRADGRLRARIGAALGETGRPAVPWFRSVWAGAVGGATAMALAASLAFAVFVPVASDTVVADVTNAHLRAIASDHLIDVVSTDRHTVKPWLAAHADLSPPVADFGAQGFKLIGGRVDFVGGERAAVTVYRHGAHIVNVFAWTYAGDGPPAFATRNGYHIVSWQSGNLVFCAVSDTAVDDLLELSRLLKALAQTDARE